jgi:hypothetical protein
MKNPRDAGGASRIEVVSHQCQKNHDFSPTGPAKQSENNPKGRFRSP